MNDQTAPVTAAGEQAVAPPPKRPRVGSLTRRMIVVAAFWITALLLMGGFALDRVLSRSIVDNFDDQLRICPQRHDRRVRDRARRRGPLQPPAGRPEVHRALFGRLFPGQRRRRGHLPLALAVGPPPAGPGPAQRRQRPRLRQQRIRRRAAAHHRARRHPSRIEGSLALPGRAVARDDRHPDPRAALDLVLELPGARHRPADPCRAADLLRPLAAPPRPAGRRRDPLGSEDPHHGRFPERGPAADRGDQPASRPQRGAGRGGAPPRRQPRPCAEDAADGHHQCRDRECAGPCRHRLPRGDGHAAAGRPPSRPRPGDRPPRLGPCPGAGLGKRRGGPARRRPALRERHRRHRRRQGRRRSGSNGRTSTR